MIRRPPRSTLTDTLFPYTPLFRSEPVLYKGELHRLHRWPGNAQVGVAPRANGRAAAEVLVAEVQPADKGHVAVRNQYLAVVAEVQLGAVHGPLGARKSGV